jgi:uncharacterized protein with HEPN domain
MRSDRERLLDIVWAVIEKDLPPLKSAIEAILRQPEG